MGGNWTLGGGGGGGGIPGSHPPVMHNTIIRV